MRRAAYVLALTVALTGCSGEDAGRSEGDSSADHAHSVFVPPAPRLLRDSRTKHANVEILKCAALAGGGQVASGTAVNTSTKAMTFRITVYFETVGADPVVVNWASTRVRVAARDQVPWVAEKAFAHDGDLTCALEAVG